jgi:hypothetical protein
MLKERLNFRKCGAALIAQAVAVAHLATLFTDRDALLGSSEHKFGPKLQSLALFLGK